MALTEKGINTVKRLCSEIGSRKCGIKMVNQFLSRLGAGLTSSDLPDTMTFANGLDSIEELLNSGEYNSAYEEAKETAREMLEDEGFSGMFENKKNIKENKKI